MSALATMPDMPEKTQAKTAPVQCRLTLEEIARLDAIAAKQPIPVDRSTVMAFALREFLKSHAEPRAKGK
jgi:hypothetical protein